MKDRRECGWLGCGSYHCSDLCAGVPDLPYTAPAAFETYEPPSVLIGERTEAQKPHGTIKKLECVFKNCRAPIVVFKTRDEVLFGCQHQHHVLNEIQVMQAQGNFLREENEWMVEHENFRFMTDAEFVYIKNGNTTSRISRDGVHPTSLGRAHGKSMHEKFIRYHSPRKNPFVEFWKCLQEIFRSTVRAITSVVDKFWYLVNFSKKRGREYLSRSLQKRTQKREERRAQRDTQQARTSTKTPEEERLSRQVRTTRLIALLQVLCFLYLFLIFLTQITKN